MRANPWRKAFELSDDALRVPMITRDLVRNAFLHAERDRRRQCDQYALEPDHVAPRARAALATVEGSACHELRDELGRLAGE